jgi:hypothetical protein
VAENKLSAIFYVFFERSKRGKLCKYKKIIFYLLNTGIFADKMVLQLRKYWNSAFSSIKFIINSILQCLMCNECIVQKIEKYKGGKRNA